MNTRTPWARAAAAAISAIGISLALPVTAYADPPDEPKPEVNLPDPQGPGCDAFKEAVPNYKTLATEPLGTALASIPEISTFNSAVTGQLNPEVNVVDVLNNGPYVVFAPDNDAFAQLPPEQLDALKSDSSALLDLVYYHVFLSLLGPDDVSGQWNTQQGSQVMVTGKGGDITINGTAKVVCGGIHARMARIYIINQVLNMAQAPEPIPVAPSLPPTASPGATETSPEAPVTSEEAPSP
ncbi:fasciclin domain-containing protein [Mycobacterium spongiae]|uniref:Fasciclin domain-containing protein n=1 Tax=Mycobacterium spongiae TaxID=886343 RepID=A0A975JYI7_9MYCO|nr:fasciclin domain-containing protein [Mycobacterium spongiae]QUR67758.1 fasciclin domain-containing protein [Mycobacterium spongiae]